MINLFNNSCWIPYCYTIVRYILSYNTSWWNYWILTNCHSRHYQCISTNFSMFFDENDSSPGWFDGSFGVGSGRSRPERPRARLQRPRGITRVSQGWRTDRCHDTRDPQTGFGPPGFFPDEKNPECDKGGNAYFKPFPHNSSVTR